MKNKDTRDFLRKLPLHLLVLVILFLVVGYLFGVIVHELFGEQDDVLDKTTSEFIATNIETDQLTKIMRAVTFFASAEFLIIAYILLVLWLWLIKRNNPFAMHVAAIAITSSLLRIFFKNIFQRVRPLDPLIEPLKNYSYPSGHASLGFIMYGLLAWLVWRSPMRPIYKYILAGLLIFFSLLVGFSRIYLRIHHTSDVIAGFCQGLAWLAISIWLLKRISLKSRLH